MENQGWGVNEDPSRLWRCLEAIEERIPIKEILDEWGVETRPASGAFEWKMRCPLPTHVGKGRGGRERTASFYVSSKNRFYCFGCNHFGGIVELVSRVRGIPHLETLRLLARRAGLLDDEGRLDESVLSELPSREEAAFDESRTAEPHIRRANAALRDHARSFLGTPAFEAEFAWLEKMGARIDELVASIGHEDWEYAQKLCDKVLESIELRGKGRA